MESFDPLQSDYSLIYYSRVLDIIVLVIGQSPINTPKMSNDRSLWQM